MAQDGPLAAGELFLGKYEIVKLIGRGGHACVYHAVNSFMGRHVAIKVLHRPGGIDREALRRGQAEAQILNRLRHPHIVEVSDAGMTEQGLLYIVMELLDGRSLREALNEHGSLAVDEVLAIAAEIADGLHAAHVTGAIHRDLKPENVFVTPERGVKILDFGIAKVADAAAWTTDRDTAHGTALYMSPEQLQLAKLTPKSDIYALGVMMYEALLGRHPVPMLIDSPSPTVFEISRAVLTREPPMLDELDARIPRSVATLVNRAMAKLPEQRFESMAELGAALRECRDAWVSYAKVHGIPIQARSLTLSEPPRGPSSPVLPSASARRLATPGTAAPVTTSSGTFGELPGARRPGLRRVLVLGAVVGTIAGAVVGFLRFSARSVTPRVDELGASARATATATARNEDPKAEPARPSAPAPSSENPPPDAVTTAPNPAAPTRSATTPAAPAPVPKRPTRPTAKSTTTERSAASPSPSPSPARAPSAPKDKVEARLQRLERALEEDTKDKSP